MHKKEVLEEFIYRLNEKASFLQKSTFWSSPCAGFSYDHSRPSKFMRELRKSGAISEGTDAVICILGDWESVAEGIIFTNHAMYVQTPEEQQQKV